MITNNSLTPSERIAFVQEGCLARLGELPPALIAELLEALESAHPHERSASDRPPASPG